MAPRLAAPLAWLLVAALQPRPCGAIGDAGELYCGKENCYALLGLHREATSSEIKKAFRKLALQWHPDKNKNPEAASKFRKIGRANEVLSDEKLRRAYDYYLDHPEDSYYHYYQYYDAVYAPQTPMWAVLLGVLLFLSGLQYLNQHWRYSSTMRAIKYQRSFQNRVKQLLEAEVAASKGKLTKEEKEVLKEKLEAQVIESEVKVDGGLEKASLRSLLLVSFLCLPWTVAKSIYEAGRWHYRFRVKKEEYGPEEREYLTRRALGFSHSRWDMLEDEEREELVARELWVKDNLKAWQVETEEEMQRKLNQSGAYKREKRWMRKNRD